MTKIEYIEKYGIEWYNEHILKYKQNYYNNNKEKCLKNQKQYYNNNKEKVLEKNKQYREENKDKISEYLKEYKNETKNGRAKSLLGAYKQADTQQNRGECTLTSDWIVNNIFNSKCVFCGEDDWTKLGCDRIDNSLPHTPDNVQCCCYDCNTKKHSYTVEEYINKIKPTSN